jgi:hypothetical protein
MCQGRPVAGGLATPPNWPATLSPSSPTLPSSTAVPFSLAPHTQGIIHSRHTARTAHAAHARTTNHTIQTVGEEGVCRYHFFKQPILLVSNPTWIKYVLSDASDNFEKERDPYLASIVGNGLLVSQGYFHARPQHQRHTLTRLLVRVRWCVCVCCAYRRILEPSAPAHGTAPPPRGTKGLFRS